jgi:hypothetical protein
MYIVVPTHAIYALPWLHAMFVGGEIIDKTVGFLRFYENSYVLSISRIINFTSNTSLSSNIKLHISTALELLTPAVIWAPATQSPLCPLCGN